MTAVRLDQVFAPALMGASLELDDGLTVVLGTAADGAATLTSLLAGESRPRRGSVTIRGRSPFDSPALRARIGSLLADEPTWDGKLLDLLDRWRDLRGLSAQSLAQTRERLRTGRGQGARASERRAVALELALALPEPEALVLYEPLASIARLDRAAVLGRVTERARTTTVVCITDSVRDAQALGGDVVLLDRGRFVRRPGVPLPLELAPRSQARLLVRATHPERLARELAIAEAVSGLALDTIARPQQLRVSGPSAAELAMAVLRAAQASGARLLSIESEPVSLDEARAASTALWRAAYERAYAAARPAPTPVPAPEPPTPAVAESAPAERAE